MYSEQEIEEIYQNILDGKIKRFPHKFWCGEFKYYHAQVVTKYLLEKILKWDEEQIKENISARLFRPYHLNGMLYNLFNDSIAKLLEVVYPNKIHVWELKKIPVNYWTNEHITIAVKYIIEEKLKWSENEVKQLTTRTTFKDNGLNVNKNSYELLNIAYPNKYPIIELKNISNVQWNKDMAVSSIKYLIEKKLKWNDIDIKKKLTSKVFIKNNLGGLITSYYNYSIYNAINDAYPKKFKPWELKRVVWTDNLMSEAIKWLVEKFMKQYNYSLEDVPSKINKDFFKENKLNYLLINKFDNSIYNALNYVYPNKFAKSQFIFD